MYYDTFYNMIKIFNDSKKILKEKGWIVSPATSYEWWDGLKSEEEIIISSILVQMSKWEVVKNKVEVMRSRGLTNFNKILNTNDDDLYVLLKGINFYKTKAKKLKRIAEIIDRLGDIQQFYDENLLLSINGIGLETADSILLFAAHKPYFPPSEYGKRVLSRVLNIEIKRKDEVKKLVEDNLQRDVYNYKLLHAGIVTVGRAFCFKHPKFTECILKNICKYYRMRNM